MIFDEYFDKVFIITLARRPDRLKQCVEQLTNLGLSKEFIVYNAIDGAVVSPPDWFSWGDGAWGCFLSHTRLLQDFMMEEGFEKKKILILEDDVLFFKEARSMFSLLSSKLGERDWGQIYLGGQHTIYPDEIEKGLYKCNAVNRTHAYAVNGKYANEIHKHLMSFTDYSGPNHHIDRQFELAHNAGKWPVYAPTWWLAGQSGGVSDVNGRYVRNQWWDLNERHLIAEAPYIYIDCDDSDYADFLYREKLIVDDREGGVATNVQSIGAMAWLRRLLPAFKCEERDLIYINSKIKNLFFLSEVKDNLQAIIDERVKYE